MTTANRRTHVPRSTQADRVISRFGTPAALQRALANVGVHKNLSTIYRWTYSRAKGGTDGLIPTSDWSGIYTAARLEGVVLSDRDMDPRPREE